MHAMINGGLTSCTEGLTCPLTVAGSLQQIRGAHSELDKTIMVIALKRKGGRADDQKPGDFVPWEKNLRVDSVKNLTFH